MSIYPPPHTHTRGGWLTGLHIPKDKDTYPWPRDIELNSMVVPQGKWLEVPSQAIEDLGIGDFQGNCIAYGALGVQSWNQHHQGTLSKSPLPGSLW